MKMFLITLLLFVFSNANAAAISADHLVQAMEKNIRGTSFAATIEMHVQKPDIDRTLVMKVFTKGRDKALVKIKSPAKDRGTANLRIGMDLWQYVPNVEKVIRIPPSLMLQNWMGSNFTNDDLVRLSSLDKDYKHKLLGEEKIGNIKVAKIECDPKPEAPVVWGKVLLWISLDRSVALKEEFYTERGKLIKTLIGSDVKTFGSHSVPTVLLMTDAKEAGSKTQIKYSDVVFDKEVSEGIFTQQNLKAPL